MQLAAFPPPPEPKGSSPSATVTKCPAKRSRDTARDDDAPNVGSDAFSQIFSALAASALVAQPAVPVLPDAARRQATEEVEEPDSEEVSSKPPTSAVTELQSDARGPVGVDVAKIRGRSSSADPLRGKIRPGDGATEVPVGPVEPVVCPMLFTEPACAQLAPGVRALSLPLPSGEAAPATSGTVAEGAGNDELSRNAPSATRAPLDAGVTGATRKDGSPTSDVAERSQTSIDPAHHSSRHPVSNDSSVSVRQATADTRRLPRETGATRRELFQTTDRAPLSSERVAILSDQPQRSEGSDTQKELNVDKRILSSLNEQVAEGGSFVGTAIAKPVVVMTSPNNHPHELSAPMGDAGMFTGSAVEVVPSSQVALAAETLNGGAQGAVETILSLADRLSSADHKSVNLRFSIAGKDLRVRVGLWGNEVRTAFRTESLELRVALAHEWQALNGHETDQVPFRFADPIFSSTESEPSNAKFSADTSSHQESAPHQPFEPAQNFAVGKSMHRIPSEQNATSTRLLPLRDSTQRLHAFA